MDLYRMGTPPEDKIVSRSKFVVNQMLPVVIRKASDNHYMILFVCTQSSDDEKMYIQMSINADNVVDKEFLDSHSLNIEVIRTNVNRLQMYADMIDDITDNNVYVSDLMMEESEEFKFHYKTLGVRTIDNQFASVVDIYLTRDVYIQINMFFIHFMAKDITAESVFMSKKYHKVEFVSIDHIKLDASYHDLNNDIVFSHYTIGCGPTLFKFNYITPHIKNRKLKNPMVDVHYSIFYGKDFLMSDLIYDSKRDCLYLIYEEYNEISNKFKCTKALRLSREIYEKSNFMNNEKIYEEVKENNDNEPK